jgi:hypothetical protein
MVQSCGEVISTAARGPKTVGLSANEMLAGGSFVIVRNTQSGAGTVKTSGTGTLRSFGGDSGGPWFAGTIALGVHSGSSKLTDGTTAYAIYTSVDAFPSIGVTILVK